MLAKVDVGNTFNVQWSDYQTKCQTLTTYLVVVFLITPAVPKPPCDAILRDLDGDIVVVDAGSVRVDAGKGVIPARFEVAVRWVLHLKARGKERTIINTFTSTKGHSKGRRTVGARDEKRRSTESAFNTNSI